MLVRLAILTAAALLAAPAGPAPQQTTQPKPDTSHLPIGDGKISTSPRVGYVFSCKTDFSNGRGSRRTGSWVHSDGTFSEDDKPVVQGEVAWPNHSFRLQLDGANRNVVGNDLPNHTTGVFPVAPDDPAAQYDRNPNSIREQTILVRLPANPEAAAQPNCVGMGPIGFLLTGAYLFNAIDDMGRDAVAHELQDHCHGHPEMRGQYHYHNLTNCLADPGTGHSALVGYALDGYGIFGLRGEDGRILHNEDLDACHGHTHAIEWDGKTVVMYHYHATAEYPYVVGCFHGTPVQRGPQGGGGNRRPGPPER